MLTLPAYGFFWFLLADAEQAPSWHAPMPETLPEFITLTSRDGRIETALTGRERGAARARRAAAVPAAAALVRRQGRDASPRSA